LIKEVTHVAVKSLRSGSSEVSKALLTTVVVVKKAKPPTAHATSVDVATSISVFNKKSQSTSRVNPSRYTHPHCRSLLLVEVPLRALDHRMKRLLSYKY